MNAQFSLFDLLMLIGITQGVVMSILLFRSKNNKRSNPFLALALLAFCWVSTKPLLHTLNLWDTAFFRYFPNSADVVIAPLVYLYFSSLVDGGFTLLPAKQAGSRKHILHFVPFILLQSYMMIVYFSQVGVSDFEEKDRIANSFSFNLLKDVENYVALASIGIYVFLSFKKLKSYREWLKNETADSTYPDFGWLRQLLVLSVSMGVFLSINYSADLFFHLNNITQVHWSAFSLFMAFCVYYLGVAGFKQPNNELMYEEEGQLELQPTVTLKTHESKLSQERSDQIQNAILKALEVDQVFLNPTLSIQELSRKLNTPQQEVSQVINTSFQKKFRDLINSYRVEEVKAKLKSSDIHQMSILGIALDCGFNSEASFYRIFKKNTGVSPKEYKTRFR